MIVKSFSGSPTPSNANHYLGQIVRQRHSGTSTETWYSSDGDPKDTQAFLEAKASNSKALASKTDNYPIWR